MSLRFQRLLLIFLSLKKYEKNIINPIKKDNNKLVNPTADIIGSFCSNVYFFQAAF